MIKMSRISRKKYMRLTAALLSAVVLTGSMDISMLRVQAAQVYSLSEESGTEMPQEDGESNDSPEVQDEEAVSGNDVPAEDISMPGNEETPEETDLPGDADLPEELEPEEEGDGGEGGLEDGDSDSDTGAVEGGADEQNGTKSAAGSGVLTEKDVDLPVMSNLTSVTASVSGISIPNKIYDGKQTSYTGGLQATVKVGEGSAAKVEDVTASASFAYEITGTVENGTPDGETYSVSGVITGAMGTITGMPKNVGTYKLKVSVSGKTDQYEYTGAVEYPFDITKRTVTVKAKDESIKITATEADLPKPFEYLYSGFVNNDTFITEPVFTCDQVEFGTPGRYVISGSGADAGPNYAINYQQGTLTVLDKEKVTMTGVVISDKVYDAKPVSCNTKKLNVTDANNTSVTGLTFSYSIIGEEDDGTKYEYKSAENIAIGDSISDGMPTNAGQYKLKIKVSPDVAGYKGIQQYNFDIRKKQVTVKAIDASISRSGNLPRFEYLVTGLLTEDGNPLDGTSEDEEIVKVFKREPVMSCNVKSTDIPGEYTIMPSGAYAGPNYLMEYQAGKLTVKDKAQVTITGIEVSNKIYDGQPVEFEINAEAYVELEDGTKAENLDFTFTYSILRILENGETYPFSTDIHNNRPTDVGQYALQVTAEGKPANGAAGETYRYTSEYPFAITPRPIVVKIKDMELRTGDERPQAYEYEIGGLGFLEGDVFTKEPEFFCDIDSMEEAGSYPITASKADAGANYSITYQPGTLVVAKREVEKTRTFLRSIALQPVLNVVNGTPLEQIALPDSVIIKTQSIGTAADAVDEITETVRVIWKRQPVDGTSYSAGSQAAQTFWLQGTISLPPDVAGPELQEGGADPLLVRVQVSVREKWIANEKVEKPRASIASGTAVKKGTKVTLSCDTEGADIYYTLDDRNPPTKESNRYTYPIEISGYTIIWAFAYKEGYPDSDLVKFSYYTSTNTGEDEDESDVPEEDIPAGGIPSGLWSTELKEYTYTGKAIKPEIRVYDYKTRLQEKKDYTIAYRNNVNAAERNSQKAPTITITGKGNYEGRLVRTFTISPKKISDPDVNADDISVAYNKKAQKPVPVVTWNGKKLAKNRDYSIPEESYTDVGTRRITVTGRGNYTGSREFEFVITDAVPMSKVTVTKIPDQVYTGKEIKPLPVVKYKGRLLELNKEYTVAYDMNVNVGTASIFIRGIKGGEFAGTKRVSFKIKAVASLSKAQVSMEFSPAEPVYTGTAITLNRAGVTLTVKGEDGNMHEVRLVQGTDYAVSYQNNVKAGKATVIFTGMGAYSGTIRKTFKIAPRQIDSMQVKVKMNSSYSYCKGGSRPEPRVIFGNKTLKPGTDYTLSYKQNTKLGQDARVIIKGKGNFGGSVDKTFTVVPQKISELKAEAEDRVYQNKNNIFKTAIRVLDKNGKRLSAGKDYDKNVKYSYSENTRVGIAGESGKTILRKAGEPVDEKDIIPVGKTINVTVTAVGNYYTGSIQGAFRIVPASISGARVTIPVQTYTGKEITLDPADLQVVVDGTPLQTTEYEIVGYSNHVNKGTAKVTIHGLHNYGGTKTVSFKIRGKGLSGL